MCVMVVGVVVGKGGGGEGEGGRETHTHIHTDTQIHTGKVSIALWEGAMISLFGSTGGQSATIHSHYMYMYLRFLVYTI